jgi:hypothetical protein
MSYRIEMRAISTDTQESLGGVTSRPITKEELESSKVFQLITDMGYILVGTARTHPHQQAQKAAKGDSDGSFQLRHFADLLDSGKYVLSVIKKSLPDGKQEISLLLDPNKS